jgi:hypothetical protein
LALKVAVMLWEAVTESWQLPVPEHAPFFQPAKTDPGAGVALRVTRVPEA